MLNEEVKHIAWDSKKLVQSYSQFFLNGYNFHIVNHSEGKSTTNIGVCIKGSNYDDEYEVNYYGMLNEVIELEYLGLLVRKPLLLHCDWCDPREEVYVRIHSSYRTVDVNQKKLWNKYEPFVLAQQETSVFHTYPTLKGDNSN